MNVVDKIQLSLQVSYSLYENSECCLYMMFENVPKEKISLIKPKLDAVLEKIVESEDIDMKRLKSIINRQKLELLSSFENNPHECVAHMVIGHVLYGNTKDDVSLCISILDHKGRSGNLIG